MLYSGSARGAGVPVSAEGVSVIVPAYNEAAGIGPVLAELREVLAGYAGPSEILVVDDGSTDGTAAVAEGAGVRVVRRESNRGYGAAIAYGLHHAAHDLIAITDADGTYPPAALSELLAAVDGYDMVVGARTAPDAAHPLVRRPAKWVLTRLAHYLVQMPIPDLNSGMRIMRRGLIEQYRKLLPAGFSFTTTITLAALSNDHPVRFIAIAYHPRVGASKIRPVHDTLNFVQLIIRTTMYFNPLRVFLPLSAGILAAAALALVAGLTVWTQIPDITVIVLVSLAIQVAVIGLLADLIDKRS